MVSNSSLMLTLAARNVFRNKRRTWLTVALIASGLAALIIADAFIRGSMTAMVNISTQTFLGQAQLHHRGFRETQDVDLYLSNATTVIDELKSFQEVKAVSGRTLSGAMIASSDNVSSVVIYGVQGPDEASVSQLKTALVSGSYLQGKAQEIILGAELADILSVALGDRIVVTMASAHGGELSQELFRLSGIFKFNDRNFDTNLAFINLDKAQSMLNISGLHEVAVQFSKEAITENQNHTIWQQFNRNNLELLAWRELSPQLSSMLEMFNYSTFIIALIMFTLVGLGIINTMFMAIFERHYEFGILLAIGTKPHTLFKQVLLEGTMIALISIVLGNLVAGICNILGAKYGIDFMADLEVSGLTLNEPIYLQPSVESCILLSLSLLIITLLACIYPARYGAGLSPAIAMRRSS